MKDEKRTRLVAIVSGLFILPPSAFCLPAFQIEGHSGL